MNEHERFLKLLDSLEIPREAYWRWRLKRAGAPSHVAEAILEGARKAQAQPLEFLENLAEEETRNPPSKSSDDPPSIT